jgi:hypothetical protein
MGFEDCSGLKGEMGRRAGREKVLLVSVGDV